MPAYEVEIEHRESDQVFSYYHDNHMLHFNASLLARLHKVMPDEFRRITMDIGEAEHNLCMAHRGIEEPKVERLTFEQMREPGYGVLFPEGTFTIVDGHHRLVRLYREGVRAMDLWVTDHQIWQHCLVQYDESFEKELAKGMPERVENPTTLPSEVTIHPKGTKP